jgi:hypothetical protein
VSGSTCDVLGPRPPGFTRGGAVFPRVKCNRSPVHEGLHRLYDKNTFAVLYEWDDGLLSVTSERSEVTDKPRASQ